MLVTWVNEIDGYSRFSRRVDPSELVSAVKKIGWLRFSEPGNLIHLPGKLAGVFDSLNFGS